MIFIGGATGATGQEFVRHGHRMGVDLVVHVRPKSEAKYRAQQPDGPEPALFDLDDADALKSAMEGCKAVVSMIGTMAKRFDSGDTYAKSDIGTTQSLVDAAKAVGAEHFILMSGLGAEVTPGAYYAAKREAERIVRESGLKWTITRPSFLYGNDRGSSAASVIGALGVIPGLKGCAEDWKGIPVEVVGLATLKIARDGLHQDAVVSGRDLWPLGELS